MSALPATARLLACAALLLPLAAGASEHRYRYDTVHSQVLFSVSHDGYSRPFGRLHIARGWLRFDPDDWSRAATELDIDLASLDMGDPDWNQAVLEPRFLDVAKARYAHFASTGVERTDDSHGVLHGELTLRGVTRPLDIPFTFNRQARTIFGMHTVAGFSATAMLDRTRFGLTTSTGSIGRNISVWLEIEAIREDRTRRPESADASQ
ncbi:YceI family protein [Frateuria edaphi]|jgi:polyisoprenoid-binding protein YceI|uniref:YceI family protein n=1 Tax=Frateuria edaphi TaxID=2898793 RepID=UPI001E2CB054|nr:YceI family protein [Frateuria edaphi]UGB44931.1 YceI family protein [Frateuria edaphi]